MAGVAENLNVCVTLTLEKKRRLKWCVGGNYFPLSDYRTTIKTTIKRLLHDYQTTFQLRCGNFILAATVCIRRLLTQTCYSGGQNKVPTAELKSRLIVVQKSFDSRSIVAQWKIVSAYAPL